MAYRILPPLPNKNASQRRLSVWYFPHRFPLNRDVVETLADDLDCFPLHEGALTPEVYLL